ncbi:hypothetical protein BU586_12345 [Staphylococcus agnetis]|uniref:YdcF family protein n=4 Tax=Staphylococcus TaxID=1279 RepID=UPI000D1AE968|nr:YdcF family protein [Staphylococcus agnetis]MCO4325959.1 YdcF family protein [Staphylococcus agnetis]MCO4356799.1 YdcF family protein [Staphylococcus agnetis]MCO4362471.1 YdcF family protein [Staphylococcus agnetis]MCO4369863.1 YdcF family protein [Staphylococcus agnetis]PTH32034.1 hypothetical protein BU589_08290 [Staphylococcus agnetis]
MYFVSPIITSLIISLLFIISAKRNFNVRIELFNVLLILNMILVTFNQFTQFQQWRQYAFVVIMMLYLLWLKRAHLQTKHGRQFVLKITCYTLALLGLSLGIECITPIVPWWLSLPLQFSEIFIWVFLLTWPIYLYLTHLLTIRLPQKGVDTLIVLGAGIYTENVTPMLKARLDCGLTLYRQYQIKKYIVSGGQGPDEPISEALAMYRYLKQHNVPCHTIKMEDQSTNTVENFRFSKPLFTEKHGMCVTSEFHVLRALRIAQRHGLYLLGYGAPSPITLRAKALLRDYCGLLLHYPSLWCIYVIFHIILTIILMS